MSVTENNLDGLRGWLLLILLGLIVTPIRVGLYIYQTFAPIFSNGTWQSLTDPSSASYHRLWMPLLSFEIVGNLVIIVLSLIALYFFLNKSKHTPKVAITWLLYGLAFVVSDFFIADMIPLIADQPTDPDTIKEVTRSVVGAAIWVPYFLVSKRVRATFTR